MISSMPVPSKKPSRTRLKNPVMADRRSPCPVACSLDIFGDRWTLLVVRDLHRGLTRFKDFTASPEHIPTNLLAERLERLRAHGVIAQIAASDGSRHQAYKLTPKGEALLPVLAAMRDWGLHWEDETRVPREQELRAAGYASVAPAT
jgi:DNA-binding HxlR family transcriptional regulator